VRIVLASASPRRRDLLAAAGFSFDVDVANVDERRRPAESPEAYVDRVARDKAEMVAARRPDDAVLAADTVVLIDAEVLGKPVDADDAARMLTRLSGRAHEVLTGVALACRGRVDSLTARTRVWVKALSAREIGWYVASGEPFDKAGAYAIQGLASRFITGIDGSYSNVVGLPMASVAELLERHGLR
jgi:septum formation protein